VDRSDFASLSQNKKIQEGVSLIQLYVSIGDRWDRRHHPQRTTRQSFFPPIDAPANLTDSRSVSAARVHACTLSACTPSAPQNAHMKVELTGVARV
jgi:hypothetical protein